jgi:hypothetical protein
MSDLGMAILIKETHLPFYHSKMGTILLPMEQQAPTEVFEAPNEIPNKDFQILIL